MLTIYVSLYFEAVHLSSQRYNICIRRPAGATTICYIPCTYVTAIAGATANTQVIDSILAYRIQ